MVPPSSNRISRVPPYLMCRICCFVYGAITHYGYTSQCIPLQHIWSAPPRSLAATKGISIDVFSSGYWDVSLPLVSSACAVTLRSGFPIQKSPDHRILPSPRSLSQAITSFIASDCQGIHHVHLITWLYNPKQSPVKGYSSRNSNVFTIYKRLIQFSLLFWISPRDNNWCR